MDYELQRIRQMILLTGNSPAQAQMIAKQKLDEYRRKQNYISYDDIIEEEEPVPTFEELLRGTI